MKTNIQIGRTFLSIFLFVNETIEHTHFWRRRELGKKSRLPVFQFILLFFPSNLINYFPTSNFHRDAQSEPNGGSARFGTQPSLEWFLNLLGARGAIDAQWVKDFCWNGWIAFAIALSLSAAAAAATGTIWCLVGILCLGSIEPKIVYLFNLRSDQYCLRRAHTIDSSALRIPFTKLRFERAVFHGLFVHPI